MTARKGWDSLSPDRRRRLERQGLTAESYNRGAPIRESRTYAQRAARTRERFSMSPSQYTKFRKGLPPEVLRERDRLDRLARTNPAESRRQAKASFPSMARQIPADQRRVRVSFPGGEREVMNPVLWYH